MTTCPETVWETYASAWKAGSESEKQALLSQCVINNCVYRDPLAVTNSIDELVVYMLEFHQNIPGGHFVTRDFKHHNNCSIAQWDMCAGDGTVIGDGASYGEYDEHGRLVSMTGFFILQALR